MLALLITDIAFGMVSRVVPQLNVFAVGFPVKIGVAMIVVGARCRSSPAGCPTRARSRGRPRPALPRASEPEPWPHDDKTEKPTAKRREEARKKGQVAKSTDLNGALVLIGGLVAISTMGPAVAAGVGELDALGFGQIARPDSVTIGRRAATGSFMRRSTRS